VRSASGPSRRLLADTKPSNHVWSRGGIPAGRPRAPRSAWAFVPPLALIRSLKRDDCAAESNAAARHAPIPAMDRYLAGQGWAGPASRPGRPPLIMRCREDNRRSDGGRWPQPRRLSCPLAGRAGGVAGPGRGSVRPGRAPTACQGVGAGAAGGPATHELLDPGRATRGRMRRVARIEGGVPLRRETHTRQDRPHPRIRRCRRLSILEPDISALCQSLTAVGAIRIDERHLERRACRARECPRLAAQHPPSP
jgi:hypothetical protein